MHASRFAYAAVVAASIAVAGCSSLPRQTDGQIDQTRNAAFASRDQALRDNLHNARPAVSVTEQIYVSPNKQKIVNPLPAIFTQNYAVTLASVVPLSFAADRLSQLTGYRVLIKDDVYTFLEGAQTSAGANTGGNQNVAGLASAQQAERVAAQFSGGSNARGNSVLVDMSFTGTLAGLLDRIAATLSSSWRFDAQKQEIVFFRYETRIFEIEATQSTNEVGGTISNASSSSEGAQSGSSLTTTSQYKSDPYADLLADVKGMLSKDGKATVNAGTSSLTVTDTPQILARVAEFVKHVNDASTREVFIDFRLLKVQLNRADQHGIDLNLLRKDLNDTFSFATAGTLTGFGSLVGSIPSTATGGKAPWAGTSAVLKALAEQGKVETVRNVVQRTINGQPVVLQDTKQIGYLSQSQTLVSGTAPAQTTQTVSTLNVGFSMRLLPQIMADKKRLLMQVWVTLSNLDNIQTYGTGADIVQTPNTSSTDFTERFGAVSGQTLILAGFEQSDRKADYQSTLGDGTNWLAGGQRDILNNNSVYVLIMTPVVIDHTTKS